MGGRKGEREEGEKEKEGIQKRNGRKREGWEERKWEGRERGGEGEKGRGQGQGSILFQNPVRRLSKSFGNFREICDYTNLSDSLWFPVVSRFLRKKQPHVALEKKNRVFENSSSREISSPV